jgi:hypothetical protein
MVVFNATDGVFYGKIEFITVLVAFEATGVEKLIRTFKEAVEDCIALC